MPRPAKTANALKGHKTKAEIDFRKAAEEQMSTYTEIEERKETKKNKQAHKEFKRVLDLFKILEKNDGLYAAVINRYCILYAECFQLERLKDKYNDAILELSQDKELIVEDYVGEDIKDTISLAQYYKLKANFSKTILSLDAAIMSKRKMMLDIEKENLMTVASSLRSIPKTPTPTQENPLFKALQDE